jgi:DNA-binding beta-propeller fold protein YncE
VPPRRRIRAPAGALLACLAGCAAEQAGIPPPQDKLYFPTGLALDPSGRWLYVTNANADLRYNAGTLMSLDVAGAPDCTRDPVGPALENCDEGPLIVDQRDIGSFAGEIEIRSDGKRIYFPTRGDTGGVTWVDLGGDGKFGDSDVVTEVQGPGEPQPLPAEPFGLSLQDCGAGWRLLVTHLSLGIVTMIQECTDVPEAVAISPVLFPVDSRGQRRAYAIAPQLAGCGNRNYVTSSNSEAVATLLVDKDPADSCVHPTDVRLVPGPGFGVAPPLDSADEGGGPAGTDNRGIAFSADGTRAWVASREPPTLLLVDTSEEHGLPRNRVQATAELCAEPSLVRARLDAAGRTLVYVVCFATNQIFVVDGLLMELDDVIETGRGPAALEFDEGRRRAFIANFAENTVGVIDLDPESPTYHHMVRTLGLPEPLLR